MTSAQQGLPLPQLEVSIYVTKCIIIEKLRSSKDGTIYLKKNSDNKPWAYICSKGFLVGLFSEGLIIGGNFVFSKWVGLVNKNGLKCKDNSLQCKQLKTATSNSPWANYQKDINLTSVQTVVGSNPICELRKFFF